MAEPIRLQKFFTDCGVLSRRAAEAEILAGNVTVNGSIATLGDKVDPDRDRVEYKGKQILPRWNSADRLTVMLNKPRGYVTTSHDEKGRKTVTDLVADAKRRLYPIGRLDMNSEGLLLLTDDGELANRLTHPKHEIPKIYHVSLSPAPTKEQLERLAAPMELDGRPLLPIGIQLLSPEKLELTLYEGRNRQIRRMCEAVGLRVRRLQRVAIGELTLGGLPVGRWRALTGAEIAYLYAHSDEKKKKGTDHAGSITHSK